MTQDTLKLETPRNRVLDYVLRQRGAQVGLLILIVLILVVAGAPLLTALQPNKVNPMAAFQPPSAQAPMGTDNLGRDVLTRFLYGGRVSLLVGIIASIIGALPGIALGLASGYAGGWPDSIITWFVEVLMAFPGVLLALVVVAILGPGIGNVMIAVGISFIPSFVRVTRAAVLQMREQDYVLSARAIGNSHVAIIARHILPNIVRPVLALLTLGVGSAILEGAALSFIGLGVQPPDPEWGAILNAGRAFVGQAWWTTVFAGLGIFLSVLAVNLLSDALSDAVAHSE